MIKRIKIKVLNNDFLIIGIPIEHSDIIKRNIKYFNDFFSLVDEKDEVTLIISDKDYDKIKNSIKGMKIEKNYKIIDLGVILNWNVVGFLAEITRRLAENNISIGVISGYRKDYLLVKKKDLKKAVKVLKNAKR